MRPRAGGVWRRAERVLGAGDARDVGSPERFRVGPRKRLFFRFRHDNVRRFGFAPKTNRADARRARLSLGRNHRRARRRLETSQNVASSEVLHASITCAWRREQARENRARGTQAPVPLPSASAPRASTTSRSSAAGPTATRRSTTYASRPSDAGLAANRAIGGYAGSPRLSPQRARETSNLRPSAWRSSAARYGSALAHATTPATSSAMIAAVNISTTRGR